MRLFSWIDHCLERYQSQDPHGERNGGRNFSPPRTKDVDTTPAYKNE